MRLSKARRLHLAFGLGLLFLSVAPSQAQVILSGGLDWNVLSFRPNAEEQTPSLYGYGLDLSASYVIMPAVELGLFTSYEILNLNAAKFFAGNADQLAYGIETGIRLSDSVSIAARYGAGQLSVDDDRVDRTFEGRWDSALYGFRVGGFWSTKRHRYVQVGLSYVSGFVSRQDKEIAGLVERRVDMISLYVTYLIMVQSSGMRPFTLY